VNVLCWRVSRVWVMDGEKMVPYKERILEDKLVKKKKVNVLGGVTRGANQDFLSLGLKAQVTRTCQYRGVGFKGSRASTIEGSEADWPIPCPYTYPHGQSRSQKGVRRWQGLVHGKQCRDLYLQYRDSGSLCRRFPLLGGQ
jgi:hypothetical protein